MKPTTWIVLLLACALLAAPTALAHQPESPPGQSGGNGGSGSGNGGNGNGQGAGGVQGAAEGPQANPGQGNAGDSGNADPGAGGDGHAGANGNGQGGSDAASAQSAADGGPGQSNGVGQSGPDRESSAGVQGHGVGTGTGQGTGGASGGDAPAGPAAGAQGGPSQEGPNGQGHALGGAGSAEGPGDSGGAASGNGPGHGGPAADGPRDGTSAPPAIVTDASDALSVQRAASGNVLAWSVPADASQVQVWRLESDGWVPVAVLQGGDGGLVDPAGGAMSEYRLTWSSEALGSGGLALAAKTLPITDLPAPRALGQLLALLMWGGVAAVGLVRANVPRRVLETRPGAEHQILPLLAGLPGVDVPTLERVSAAGLRTVAQLRAIDPDTLCFWARVPAPIVRQWKETLELLVWPALPAGAGERLALAGHGSLAHLASANPDELLMRLRTQSGVDGPGVPADEAEIGTWIAEARLALGVTTAASPRADVTPVEALRSPTPSLA